MLWKKSEGFRVEPHNIKYYLNERHCDTAIREIKCISNVYKEIPNYEQIRSKLSTLGNPLNRFMKSKNLREIDSGIENLSHQNDSRISERIDELRNPVSGINTIFSRDIESKLK